MSYYEIHNKADRAEVWVYEAIGEDMWGEGLSAKSFAQELSAIHAGQIDVHINSPGGNVFDGQAMANALKRHPAAVTSYIDGAAASIATAIALAADNVVMAKNAAWLVHNPFGMVMGEATDMRRYADSLDMIRDTLVDTYEAKTGRDREDIEALMAEDRWMNAEEALAFGFVDEVGISMEMAAYADFDYAALHIPTPTTAAPVAEAEPEAEAAPEPEPEAEAAEVSDITYLGLALGLSPTDKE